MFKVIGGLAAFLAISAAQIIFFIGAFLIGMALAQAGEMDANLAVGVGLAAALGLWIVSEILLKRTPLAFLRLSQNPIFHLNV